MFLVRLRTKTKKIQLFMLHFIYKKGYMFLVQVILDP